MSRPPWIWSLDHRDDCARSQDAHWQGSKGNVQSWRANHPDCTISVICTACGWTSGSHIVWSGVEQEKKYHATTHKQASA